MAERRGSQTSSRNTELQGRLKSETLRRHLSLGAALLASGATGVVYTFSVYSGGLKKKLGLSQSEVDSIGQFTFLGGCFTFLTGAFNDRFGPVLACSFGGLLLTIIEVVYWAIAQKHLHTSSPEVWLQVLAPFIQMCQGFVVAGVFTTLVRNFPRERGAVVGLGKGWVGLFGGASTQVFAGLFFVPDKHDPASIDYVLFCAVLIAILTVPTAPFLRVVPNSASESRRGDWLLRRRLQCGFVVVVLCAAVVALAAILKPHLNHAGHLAIAVVIIALWALLPPLVNLPKQWACRQDDDDEGAGSAKKQGSDSNDSIDGSSDSGDGAAVSEADPMLGPQAADGAPDVSPDLDTLHMLRSLDCWLLYFTAATTIGGGTMLTTNLGQICDATGLGSSSSAVSIFSVGQALSRMASGMLSDFFMLRKGITRPLFLTVSPLFMAAGHLILLAADTDALLYIGVLLAGAGFGAMWPLMVVLVSELFGKKHLGTNYMVFDGYTSALGSLALAKFLPQSVYDHYASSGSGAPEDAASSSSSGDDCYGRACFGLSFGLIAALAGLAVLCAVLLHWRNRELYRRIIAQRTGRALLEDLEEQEAPGECRAAGAPGVNAP